MDLFQGPYGDLPGSSREGSPLGAPNQMMSRHRDNAEGIAMTRHTPLRENALERERKHFLQGRGREKSNPETSFDPRHSPPRSARVLTRPFDHNASSWSVLKKIRESISVSGYRENHVQVIQLHVDWDVEQYLLKELGGTKEFASILTLTGTARQAYAASCTDYVGQFWPESGIDMVEQFLPLTQKVMPGDTIDTELVGGRLQVSLTTPHLKSKASGVFIRAIGPEDDLVEFVQILAWVTAVFRCPIPGQLSSSKSYFEAEGDSLFVIRGGPLVKITEERLCWCPMFNGMVIAQGFPTPDRSDELGVEMPFDLMVVLGRIWYPMEYLEGYVLKGHSTILVPTRWELGSCQWHFICNEDHEEKATLESIECSIWDSKTDITLEVLRTARAFVGWTSSAEVHAGTRTSGFESIGDSKSAYSRPSPRISRELTPSIGTSGLGFLSVNLGTKLTIPKGVFGPVGREHILLEDMLLNSKENSTVLWDSGTRCGWMVSELAVILMIVHVWASRQTDSEVLLAKLPFAQQSSDDGRASYNTIREHNRLQLRSKAEYGEDLMFMAQVKNIFAALESRKEEMIVRDKTPSWFRSSKILRGWELMDIAKLQPWFKEKRVTLDDTCGSWPLIIKERPEVVVLFCKGLADLISPADVGEHCQIWKSIPRDHSYLAATTSSLVNSDIRWHDDRSFPKCAFDGKKCPPRLRELYQKAIRQPNDVPRTGAIIIGKTHSSLHKACCPAAEKSPNVGDFAPLQKEDSTHENYDEAATKYGKSALRLVEANIIAEDSYLLPSRNDTIQVEKRTEEIGG